MITAIITCAGKGIRANFGYNKLFKKLDGLTVLEKAIIPFDVNERIDELIITASEEDKETITEIAKRFQTPTKVITGGLTRRDSVYNALQIASGEIVLIHDGARPYVYDDIINTCIDSVIAFGTGITAIPCSDTIAQTDLDGDIISADRSNKLSVQTPQGFFKDKLLTAYTYSLNDDFFTDDSGIYARYIGKCHVVEGDSINKKLTYPEDFPDDIFVGTGFDLHTLVQGRKLILGGIKIPHSKGLLGHSDADVLIHSIMDALLSSAGLRDIGYYFSDKDPKYKDISSVILLNKVLEMIKEQGYEVKNVSAVIMAEKPKLSTFIPEICANLARLMNIPKKNMGITCTTLEGIGIVGREEGIAAQSYCLLNRVK